MSASMYLYKVNTEAYLLPSKYDKYSSKELDKLRDKELDEYLDEPKIWSDGKQHKQLSLTSISSWIKMGYKIYTYRHLKSFFKYAKFEYQRYYTNKYLTVDVVSDWQGWDLKKSFLYKKCTFVYCVNKKQMYKFMYRYVKPKLHKYFIENFINNIIEGEMIFECAW